MDFINPELMYEFHIKELSQVDALKQYADHAVAEIKSATGWDSHIHINIEPEAKNKHLFVVSMSVFGLGEPIIVKKSGKNVLAILKKVRKTVLRQAHRLSEKRVSHRRNRFLKEHFAT